MFDEVNDLWWIPERYEGEHLLIGVAHSEPISDCDGLGSLWCSLLSSGEPSEEEKLCPLSFLDAWRSHWEDTNVFRTLYLRRDQRRPSFLVGPFYVDIDADLQPDGSYDLEDAAVVARTVVEILEEDRVKEEADIRILFTGHKGFSIEIRPEALGLASEVDTLDLPSWRDELGHLIRQLRARRKVAHRTTNFVTAKRTVIDHFVGSSPPHGLKRSHRHLRLANSKNVWLDESGCRRARAKRVVSSHDLLTKSAMAIADESGCAGVNSPARGGQSSGDTMT